MTDKKAEEFSAIGKRAMVRGDLAVGYYFDLLKKTVASAQTGGTECGETVRRVQAELYPRIRS
jgi:hypothetical protein